MTSSMLFAVFPYVAFSLAVVGALYRYFTDRFSHTSLSSQFLENRSLFWGSIPWHYGIIFILLAHLLAGLFPKGWAILLRSPIRLYSLELIGLALGFLTLWGIVILAFRRLGNPRILAVTSTMDWFLLLALIVQVLTGLHTALFHRWGSLWYLDIAAPWFGSLLRFSPQFDNLIPLPWMVKLHVSLGFLIIALFPFTRLVHIFTVPLSYLWRPYQVVIWNRHPAEWSGVILQEKLAPAYAPGDAARRRFLKAASGALSLLVALALGIPFLHSFVGPVFRRRKPVWARVAALKSLPLGEPVSLTFTSQNVDAYIRELELQRVWAVRHSETGVTVFSSICPHLGCHFNWDPRKKNFICPCHDSIYSLDGKVLAGPAPRPLDTLPLRVEGAELLVEWRTFKVGIPEKEPV